MFNTRRLFFRCLAVSYLFKPCWFKKQASKTLSIISSNQMDGSMYNAAIEGRVDYLLHNIHGINLEDAVTPNGNTLLHVTALYGESAAECVNVIVKSYPSLLTRANLTRETPLHIASREGHFEFVRELIASAKALEEELESGFGGGEGAAANTKKMLRLTSDNGDTALHKAVRYRHVDVVKLLVEEDPGFSHPPNKAMETPVYLAAEKGLEDCVKLMLKTCTSPSCSGPGGRTALHAAVIFDSEGSTMELMNWNLDLVNVADQSGWTPFHYAASLGHVKRARQLLNSHQSTAYVTTKNNEKDTALHIAVGQGHLDIIKDIASGYPTCLEMVNGKGRNMLHVAVESNELEVIKYILQSHMLTRSLVNHKDNEGNTPLHLLAASGYYISDLVMHPKAEIMVFNNKNLSPLDIAAYKCTHVSSQILEEWKHAGTVLHLRGENIGSGNQTNPINPAPPTLVSEFVKTLGVVAAEKDTTTPAPTLVSQHTGAIPASSTSVAANRDKEDWSKVQQSHIVVIALIVTVTFAAGFTMPGGFIGTDGPNQGMAALSRVAAFKAFVITDSLAFFFSCISLFIHFGEVRETREKLVEKYLTTAAIFTMLAIFAMMVAFTTGTYAVLVHSLGLAIAITVFCIFSFVICFLVIYYW